MKITQEYKEKVTAALLNFMSNGKGSLNTIVEQVRTQSGLKVNQAYVSQIKNGKYSIGDSNIADKYFLAIGDLFNINVTENVWGTVETDNYLDIQNNCEEARMRGSVIAISGKTATGKSHAVKGYFKENALTNNSTTYMMRCKARFNKRSFVSALAKAVHVPSGGNVDVVCEDIVNKINRTENGLLIIDEAEHLSPKMLELLKDIYDDIGSCGIIVVIHTNRLKSLFKQVSKGYGCTEQIWRRFFEDYREVMSLGEDDIVQVLEELGLNKSAWLHKSALEWLISESGINNYSIFKKYIETAYTEYQLTTKVITKRVIEALIPMKSMRIEY